MDENVEEVLPADILNSREKKLDVDPRVNLEEASYNRKAPFFANFAGGDKTPDGDDAPVASESKAAETFDSLGSGELFGILSEYGVVMRPSSDSPFKKWDSILTEVRRFSKGNALNVILRARVRGTDTDVVIKVMFPEGITGEQFVETELAAAKQFSGGHFPNLLDEFTVGIDLHSNGDDPEQGGMKPYQVLIMDAARCNLDELTNSTSGISEKMKYRIMIHLLWGLSKMHDEGHLHRDIKPQNVLIYGDPDSETGFDAKLCDFGLAVDRRNFYLYEHVKKKKIGTVYYTAPEIYTGHGATMKSDIFSLGLTLFKLFTGSWPAIFNAPDFQRCTEYKYRIAGHPIQEYMSTMFDIRDDPHWGYLNSKNPEIAKLIASMTSREEFWRPSAGGALLTARAIAEKRGADRFDLYRSKEIPESPSEWFERVRAANPDVPH